MLDSGEFATIADLAAREGIVVSYLIPRYIDGSDPEDPGTVEFAEGEVAPPDVAAKLAAALDKAGIGVG